MKKISYYNLQEEARGGVLPELVGRTGEIARLDRLLGRRVNNNALIVGEGGIGKTALVYGWARHLRQSAIPVVQIDSEHLYDLGDAGFEDEFATALVNLPGCVLFIDDFGHEAHRNVSLLQRMHRLFKKTLLRPDVCVVLAMRPHEFSFIEQEYPAFLQHFDAIALKRQSALEYRRVLSKKMPKLNARHRVIVPDDALREIVALAQRYASLGELPRSAMQLLDESIALSASQGQKVLGVEAIAHIVEAKTGVPRARLGKDEMQRVKELEANLNARIVDQHSAIAKIATTLQRAKLGLRSPNRPLGSFLLLGPSGVGKTETAKCVAELMFGRAESFTRIDMSEFQQDHTVQRLIGAPPGYVGYESGGALTGALKNAPHSLILLDEIEKAHPKVFDIFLQVLDDGRLTSGQSETVDARNAIFMATSNAAVEEILAAHARGADMSDEAFVKETVVPILAKTFRLEFLNRFDSILVFEPLSAPALVQIAQLEIKKIEQRLSKHRVHFKIEPREIERRIRRLADPRFGARPVKRFVEETCETLLAQSLLARS